MSGKLTEQEVLDVLHAIERGEVTIPEEEKRAASEQYANNVTYHLSNGWTFVIFNDCDEWDYIDEVTAPDGRSLTFDDIAGGPECPFGSEPMPTLYKYTPPPAVCVALWGIPS